MVTRRLPLLTVSLLVVLIGIGGCRRAVSPHPAGEATAEDSVVWLEQGLKLDGIQVAVGYRESESRDSDAVEPLVVLTRQGVAVADVMVFCRVSGGSESAATDHPTVFQPAAGTLPAHYTPGILQRPNQAPSDPTPSSPEPLPGQEGALQNGTVQDGTVRDGTVRDGSGGMLHVRVVVPASEQEWKLDYALKNGR